MMADLSVALAHLPQPWRALAFVVCLAMIAAGCLVAVVAVVWVFSSVGVA
jgi:hypothetical protein